MFARYFLILALLLLAASAQAMTPARQGANGSGGSCPEAQAQVAAEAAVSKAPTLAADGAEGEAGTAPGVVPIPSKTASGNPARSGTRWHSFLPGMFK